MTRLAEALKVLLLALCCWLAGESAWLVHGERVTVNSTLRDLHTTILEAGLTLKNLREASAIWAQSSKEQSSQTTMAMSRVAVVAGQFSTFVSRVDSSVNSTLIPTLSNAISHQDASLSASQAALQAELSRLAETTVEAQKVLVDADSQIASPDVKLALDNFATSSANLATAAHEGAGMMVDAHQLEDYEIKQIEAPVTKAKVAWNFFLNIVRHLYF